MHILIILRGYLVLLARCSAVINNSAQSLDSIEYKEMQLVIYHYHASTIMHNV